MLIAWAAIANIAGMIGKNKGQGKNTAAEEAELERQRKLLEQQQLAMIRPKVPFR
jgi:hypothetical protein